MGNATNRSMLGFQDIVKKHFAFLEDLYGFRCSSSDLYIVKYNSDKVYLNVYHEKISYEIYFEIGILPEDYNNQLKVYPSDIIKISDEVNKSPYYQASNKSDINAIVEKLSKLVRRYANEVLNGSLDFFKIISDERTQKQQDALLLEELKNTEEKAKSEWNKKNFKKVVEIYNPYKNYLNPVQLKRLEYAEKIIAGKD